MNMPLVSIVVPIYKVPERFLRQCIESCINQTLKDIEIILVDDGSPDNCGVICDDYAAEDSRIKVIHKHNGGLVSARNAGFDILTGEWHMYLDGDDWIHQECLSDVILCGKKYNNPDVVFWNVVQYIDGKVIQRKSKWACGLEEKFYTGNDCKELARQSLVYSSGITPAYAKLINTNWARNFNIMHDPKLKQGAEGVEFSLRLFYYSNTVLYLNKNYNYYRYNPSSISKAINEENTTYITACFEVIKKDINEFDNAEEFRLVFYQRVVYGLIAMAMSTYFHPENSECISLKISKYKRVIEGTSLYKESIKHCPTICMDKFRIIVLYLLKFKMYRLLSPIARIKLFLFKKGYNNY